MCLILKMTVKLKKKMNDEVWDWSLNIFHLKNEWLTKLLCECEIFSIGSQATAQRCQFYKPLLTGPGLHVGGAKKVYNLKDSNK